MLVTPSTGTGGHPLTPAAGFSGSGTLDTGTRTATGTIAGATDEDGALLPVPGLQTLHAVNPSA
jgi:hypothetical protein